MTANGRTPLEPHRLLIDACLKHDVPFWWQGGGTLLISGRGVRTVIEDVETFGAKVIGLEGFELESMTVHPRLDLIYDASVAPRSGPAAVAAEWGSEVWVDVTLAARPTEPT